MKINVLVVAHMLNWNRKCEGREGKKRERETFKKAMNLVKIFNPLAAFDLPHFDYNI